MDDVRLLDCLHADYLRLREVAGRDLTAPVPSCPGWTVTDLVRHLAEVYLHKAEAIRARARPDPWPPDLTAEPPLPLLDRAYSALADQLRRPADQACWTWYQPDQTVGFWIRRMAQETVIHRVDAELALDQPVAEIPDDLALDGIDEVLVAFLDYASHQWTAEFADLPPAPGPPVAIRADSAGWLVTPGPDGVDVARSGADEPAAAATVQGPPAELLRWLWGRGGDRVEVEGSADTVAVLRRLLVTATQ